MLQYLIILLDDTSTSFCHYENQKTARKPIPLETLRKAIRFAMMENLMIQFVYPDYDLPEDIKMEVESIDHSKIKPFMNGSSDADVVVVSTWDLSELPSDVPVVLRTSKSDLFKNYQIVDNILGKIQRLNIVITDVETFTDADFLTYKSVLESFAKTMEKLYVEGKTPQLNILTDRMMLNQMNNCGSGDFSITLAPNGKFYICPAFYLDVENDYVGDLENGLDIKNPQLFRLNHAPICRHCDAWQCRRCVWLNRKTTLEVNTPGHEQCVVAHLERNASKDLLRAIRKHGTFLPEYDDIKDIKYLDPFDNKDDW
jgi:CXXX repeat peptide maturase